MFVFAHQTLVGKSEEGWDAVKEGKSHINRFPLPLLYKHAETKISHPNSHELWESLELDLNFMVWAPSTSPGYAHPFSVDIIPIQYLPGIVGGISKFKYFTEYSNIFSLDGYFFCRESMVCRLVREFYSILLGETLHFFGVD